jgi:hypothetical protein
VKNFLRQVAAHAMMGCLLLTLVLGMPLSLLVVLYALIVGGVLTAFAGMHQVAAGFIPEGALQAVFDRAVGPARSLVLGYFDWLVQAGYATARWGAGNYTYWMCDGVTEDEHGVKFLMKAISTTEARVVTLLFREGWSDEPLVLAKTAEEAEGIRAAYSAGATKTKQFECDDVFDMDGSLAGRSYIGGPS